MWLLMQYTERYVPNITSAVIMTKFSIWIFSGGNRQIQEIEHNTRSLSPSKLTMSWGEKATSRETKKGQNQVQWLLAWRNRAIRDTWETEIWIQAVEEMILLNYYPFPFISYHSCHCDYARDTRWVNMISTLVFKWIRKNYACRVKANSAKYFYCTVLSTFLWLWRFFKKDSESTWVVHEVRESSTRGSELWTNHSDKPEGNAFLPGNRAPLAITSDPVPTSILRLHSSVKNLTPLPNWRLDDAKKILDFFFPSNGLSWLQLPGFCQREGLRKPNQIR